MKTFNKQTQISKEFYDSMMSYKKLTLISNNIYPDDVDNRITDIKTINLSIIIDTNLLINLTFDDLFNRGSELYKKDNLYNTIRDGFIFVNENTNRKFNIFNILGGTIKFIFHNTNEEIDDVLETIDNAKSNILQIENKISELEEEVYLVEKNLLKSIENF